MTERPSEGLHERFTIAQSERATASITQHEREGAEVRLWKRGSLLSCFLPLFHFISSSVERLTCISAMFDSSGHDHIYI